VRALLAGDRRVTGGVLNSTEAAYTVPADNGNTGEKLQQL